MKAQALKSLPGAKTFEEAWARMEAAGYQYGGDALENVHFGWEIAQATLLDAHEQMRARVVELEGENAKLDEVWRGMGRHNIDLAEKVAKLERVAEAVLNLRVACDVENACWPECAEAFNSELRDALSAAGYTVKP